MKFDRIKNYILPASLLTLSFIIISAGYYNSRIQETDALRIWSSNQSYRKTENAVTENY